MFKEINKTGNFKQKIRNYKNETNENHKTDKYNKSKS